MYPLVWLTVFISLFAFSFPAGASSQRRVALVIGNGAYNSAPLSNSVNDATDMATVLKTCDFKVMKAINANRKQMRKAIRTFGGQIRQGAVGLFYYAGHGIQVDGENYLVPVEADVESEAEVEDECLKVSSVLRQMEAADNRLNIIILDACRNNPFGRSFRSGNRGLAKMDAPVGSILAYATSPGSVAADGAGSNGLYTSALMKHMRVPGLEIGKLFRETRIDVVHASARKQVPWESSSLMGDFYFIPPSAPDVASKTTPAKESLETAALDPAATSPDGAARDKRFQHLDSGVVFDSRTGLEWYVGPDEDMGRDKAKAWIADLEVANGQWRMPTIAELRQLYQKGAGSRNMSSLFGTTGWWVWSQEKHQPSYAWGFDFNQGLGANYWSKSNVSTATRTFAVRPRNRNGSAAGNTEAASTDTSDGRFIKLASGAVLDGTTGLEWFVGPDQDMDWDRANAWVAAIGVDGGGWRMPSAAELRGLYQSGQGTVNLPPLLKTTGWYVWSGESKGWWSSQRLYFAFTNGNQYWDKPDQHYHRRAFAVKSRK